MENVAVVALNVAVVAEAATVTEAGAVSVVLLFVMVTFAPPSGAALDSATVQVELAELPREVGVQDIPLIVGRALPVTVPPAVESAIGSPAGSAATPLLIPTTVEATAAAMVRFTLAAMPLEMTVALDPNRTQVKVPVPLVQFKDLPAATAAVPAVAEMLRTFATG